MTKNAQFVFMFDNPRVTYFPGFLSHEECDYLIDRAEGKFKPSTVLSKDENAYEEENPGRTSSGTCFERGETEKITHIERRIAHMTGTPLENGEGLQLLKYEEGQHYLPHHDFFDPNEPGYMKYLGRGGQRTFSVIMYLNDDFEDGETEFPLLRFRVVPAKGAALVFANLTEKGALDTQTLHGGRPPKNGTKYIATKWIRQKAY